MKEALKKDGESDLGPKSITPQSKNAPGKGGFQKNVYQKGSSASGNMPHDKMTRKPFGSSAAGSFKDHAKMPGFENQDKKDIRNPKPAVSTQSNVMKKYSSSSMSASGKLTVRSASLPAQTSSNTVAPPATNPTSSTTSATIPALTSMTSSNSSHPILMTTPEKVPVAQEDTLNNDSSTDSEKKMKTILTLLNQGIEAKQVGKMLNVDDNTAKLIEALNAKVVVDLLKNITSASNPMDILPSQIGMGTGTVEQKSESVFPPTYGDYQHAEKDYDFPAESYPDYSQQPKSQQPAVDPADTGNAGVKAALAQLLAQQGIPVQIGGTKLGNENDQGTGAETEANSVQRQFSDPDGQARYTDKTNRPYSRGSDGYGLSTYPPGRSGTAPFQPNSGGGYSGSKFSPNSQEGGFGFGADTESDSMDSGVPTSAGNRPGQSGYDDSFGYESGRFAGKPGGNSSTRAQGHANRGGFKDQFSKDAPSYSGQSSNYGGSQSGILGDNPSGQMQGPRPTTPTTPVSLGRQHMEGGASNTGFPQSGYGTPRQSLLGSAPTTPNRMPMPPRGPRPLMSTAVQRPPPAGRGLLGHGPRGRGQFGPGPGSGSGSGSGPGPGRGGWK